MPPLFSGWRAPCLSSPCCLIAIRTELVFAAARRYTAFPLPTRSMQRTDAEEKEIDEEYVADGQDGAGEGRDNSAQGGDAAKEADDTEGAEDADDAGGLNSYYADNGHSHDDNVKPVPGIGDERKKDVAKYVDC